MHPVHKVCAILSLLFAGLASGCPTWLTNVTGHCKCGDEIAGLIICHEDEGRAEVCAGYCVTFEYATESVVAGYCPYGSYSNMTNRICSSLPHDPAELNETTCGPYNREGLFCGLCIRGFGPAVYSYDLRCADCTDISTGYAICLYVLLEFLPITVFFFVVVIFHFNITSGPMLGYIIFCQGWTFAAQNNMSLYDSILPHLPLPLVTFCRVSFVLADIWNLHFFRFIVPSFCLSDRMTGIHVHMLSLFTAVYTVLLMAITCFVIELHGRDNRVVQFIWKPFGICFTKFKDNWNASGSIIHAFATFIMLSPFSLMYVAYAITEPTPVYNVNGTVSSVVLHYDPTIVQYSPEHIPYLVVAVILCFLLTFCPAFLLCIYPTRVYEKLSRCCSPRKKLVVKTFVEAMHSCYTNGLNGTRDYRVVAGFTIVTPAVYGVLELTVREIIPTSTGITMGFLFLIISFIVSYVRPCKSLIMNLSLSFHLMLIGMLLSGIGLWVEDFSFGTEPLAVSFVVFTAIPHLLIFIWAGYKIANCVSSQYGCHPKTALTVFKRAALSLWRRHNYEELRDYN